MRKGQSSSTPATALQYRACMSSESQNAAGTGPDPGLWMSPEVAAALKFFLSNPPLEPPKGGNEKPQDAWHVTMLQLAFLARRAAKTRQEAVLAHHLLRMASGDPAIRKTREHKLDALRKVHPSEPWDLLIIMDVQRVDIETARHRLAVEQAEYAP